MITHRRREPIDSCTLVLPLAVIEHPIEPFDRRRRAFPSEGTPLELKNQ